MCETGHSLGKLADEYTYGAGKRYRGSEPADVNLSVLKAGAMAARGAKWAHWLGEPSPDGGTVGTYEGGGSYQRGLFRPGFAGRRRVEVAQLADSLPDRREHRLWVVVTDTTSAVRDPRIAAGLSSKAEWRVSR
ncbi:M64 family metallopeptidase [Streptomyces sp. NPDC047014]|uniref:M64 family metallopeptidase n=1 Tax=Streptomyces sp. NPDC047014 TaxID=3155736 RepID=UPI0034012FF7